MIDTVAEILLSGLSMLATFAIDVLLVGSGSTLKIILLLKDLLPNNITKIIQDIRETRKLFQKVLRLLKTQQKIFKIIGTISNILDWIDLTIRTSDVVPLY